MSETKRTNERRHSDPVRLNSDQVQTVLWRTTVCKVFSLLLETLQQQLGGAGRPEEVRSVIA